MNNNEKNIIFPKCFLDYPVIAGITTRNGGVSENGYSSWNMGFNSGDNIENVIKNRNILYKSLNKSADNFVFANQTHEAKIALINNTHRGKGAFSRDSAFDGIDGMITVEKDLFITIQTADCMSIFLYDPVKSVISIVHAGWKGTKLNIAGKAVARMIRDYNCKAGDIIVYLGPSISKDNYQVGKEFHGYFSDDYLIETEGKLFLDIKKCNYDNCIKAGILKENLFSGDYCTFNDGEIFYSYRRDGKKTGRMLSFICLQ